MYISEIILISEDLLNKYNNYNDSLTMANRECCPGNLVSGASWIRWEIAEAHLSRYEKLDATDSAPESSRLPTK